MRTGKIRLALQMLLSNPTNQHARELGFAVLEALNQTAEYDVESIKIDSCQIAGLNDGRLTIISKAWSDEATMLETRLINEYSKRWPMTEEQAMTISIMDMLEKLVENQIPSILPHMLAEE